MSSKPATAPNVHFGRAPSGKLAVGPRWLCFGLLEPNFSLRGSQTVCWSPKMVPTVEVIDIGSSSDEDEDGNNNSSGSNNNDIGTSQTATQNTSQEDDERKPAQIVSQHGDRHEAKPELSSLDAKRAKIDQLLEVHLRHHSKLLAVEYLMSSTQRQRWHNHLATTSRNSSVYLNPPTQQASPQSQRQQQSSSVYDETFGGDQIPRQRPPWFIDPPTGISTAVARRAPRTTYVRRKKYKRKKRSASSRSTTARARPTTSSSGTRRTTGSAPSAGTSYTRASGSADRKPSKSRLQNMLAKVKRERS